MRGSTFLLICMLLVSGFALGASALGGPPSSLDEDTIGFAPTNLRLDTFRLVQDSGGGGEPAGPQEQKRPWSLGLTYSLYSDYVFRGINLSEYPGEGREKPNHQLSVDLGLDLASLWGGAPGSLGWLTFTTWFEWYADQEILNPAAGGNNLQEVDYTIGWSYDVDSITSTVGIAFVFYTFPHAKPVNTQELDFSLDHNDAWMWNWLWPDNEDGVLNPSILYAIDLDATHNGGWIELGFSHEWSLTDYLALTPSVTVAIDHGYLDPILGTGRGPSTRLAYVQYGMNLDYDLTTACSLPSDYGSLTLSGFLFFNDAVGNPEDNGLIQDEFFGGVSVGWSF